ESTGQHGRLAGHVHVDRGELPGRRAGALAGVSTGDYLFLRGVLPGAPGNVWRTARLQDTLFWSGGPGAVPGPVRPLYDVSAAALSDPAAPHRRRLLLQLRPDRRRAGDRVFRLLRPGGRSASGDVLRGVPVSPCRGRRLDAAGTAGRTTCLT